MSQPPFTVLSADTPVLLCLKNLDETPKGLVLLVVKFSPTSWRYLLRTFLDSLLIPDLKSGGQGRHFIFIYGGSGAVPPAGVQGAEHLGGGQGAKAPEAPAFLAFKGVPDMYFCG